MAFFGRLEPTIQQKISALGLWEMGSKAILGPFLERHILARTDVKPATLEVWAQPCRNLTTFFGQSKLLGDITPGDADEFKHWLLAQPLSRATIAKRLSFARTFFHVARKHRLIEENPFCEVRIPTADIRGRQRYVPKETIRSLLQHADPSWQAILGLARFGGLRCPSEVMSIKWEHVDWEKSRVSVPSPKTERYGKASRDLPLFPELRTILDQVKAILPPQQTYVVGDDYYKRCQGRRGWRNCNLRKPFEMLLKRAGITPWPKLFHNLRSSFATDLRDDFPGHVVNAWMGHDEDTSLRHYAQITESHFRKASGLEAESSDGIGKTGGRPVFGAVPPVGPTPNDCKTSVFGLHLNGANEPGMAIKMDFESTSDQLKNDSAKTDRTESYDKSSSRNSSDFLNRKRRRGDSNPRWSFPHTAFPVLHNQPLCHPSGCVANRYPSGIHGDPSIWPEPQGPRANLKRKHYFGANRKVGAFHEGIRHPIHTKRYLVLKRLESAFQTVS